MSLPELSLKPTGNALPPTIDIYLPGREVWDDFRMEMLDERLTELGYSTKIISENDLNSKSQQIDDLNEHEQDLRTRLDLRNRLEAFLDDNPEFDLQIPPINGIFPLPISTPPSHSPLSHSSSPSDSPESNSRIKSTSPLHLTQPIHHSPSTLDDLSKPIDMIGLTQNNPILPPLKPTALEFKPGAHHLHSSMTHHADQLNSSDLCTPSLNPTNSLHSPFFESNLPNSQLIHSHSTPLVADNTLDDLLTDSDSDQPLHQPKLDYEQLYIQKQKQDEDKEDDLPLAALQHNLKTLRQSATTSIVSVNPPNNLELPYDGDADLQSNYTNPSDDRNYSGDQQHLIISPHHQLSIPQNRIGRSHTFGNSDLIPLKASMSAGKGQPHNWINGSENEEEVELISNPSDEEEAELHQLHRVSDKNTTIIRSASYSEPIHPQPSGSNFKMSTPTSRLLLNTTSSPDHATNLAITLGRATGSVMSLGLLESSSSNDSLILNQPSSNGLNAFALEFKPTPGLSSSLISNLHGSKDSVEPQPSAQNLPWTDHDPISKSHVPFSSNDHDLKQQESDYDNITADIVYDKDEITNQDDLSSIIPFEQSVSSAPFQVPTSFPTLSALESIVSNAPISPIRKMTSPTFEQPGRDNMRTFKFPANPQSRMVLYQAQKSRSSSPVVLSTVLENEKSSNFKGLVDTFNPIGKQVSDRSSTPLTSPQQLHLNLAIDIPVSQPIDQLNSGPSVSLRQRSSFEDDSGSDLSPSVSRPTTKSGKLKSSISYELIPTQPRPSSLYAKYEEEKHLDDNVDQSSPRSVASSCQTEDHQKRWIPLEGGNVIRTTKSCFSGSQNCAQSKSDRQIDHPTHSVPLVPIKLDIDAPKKCEHLLTIPPGSPFSPFDGTIESGGSMYSIGEESQKLKRPSPTSHLILTPPAHRMLSLKPCHNNLAQTFKVDDRRHSLPHHLKNEELDGLPEISIRSRNLSPSPSARWLGSSEDGNSKGFLIPTPNRSKTDFEDETLFSSRILEKKEEEELSSRDSTSDSSLSIESNSKRHHNGKHFPLHGFMADLERLLTKKLKGLRQDLGELHSLKVDWDSLKRDAIIDEITSLMDNILRSWSEPWKEKIEASIIPDQKADIILAAINRWGGKTQEKLIETLKHLPPPLDPNSTSKDLQVDLIQKMGSELEQLTTQLATLDQRFDLDSITAKLSESFKPQIDQLIDMASDKSETSHLISKQLEPFFIECQTEMGNMTKHILTGMSEHKEKQISIDESGRVELLKQFESLFVTFHTDSQQNLLKLIDKQMAEAVFTGIRDGTADGFGTIKQLDSRNLKMFNDLSSQVNAVSEEIIRKLQVEVERGISRREESDSLIDQLKARNSELELNIAQARSDCDIIKSERQVEKDRIEADRTRLVHERDGLEELVRNLQAEQVIQNREKMDIEVEKNRFAENTEEMRQSIEQLNLNLGSYKAQELQWQIVKSEQQEKIANLQLQNQISESQIHTIKTEMELRQKFHETRELEKENELIRLKEKDLDQSKQIKKLIEDQIPLIKNFDSEIRDLIQLKSETDGEIRTLRKRISDQDEQIGNLHQSSASKQQALAMANQKLSESERRGKQESEGLKVEIEKLKSELNQVKMESKVEYEKIQNEKIELENQMNRLRSEVEIESVKESTMCRNLSIKLEQSNQRSMELEEEVKSFKDLNELLKNQIEDLCKFHENQKHEIQNHLVHNPNQSMLHGNFQFHDQPIDWTLSETRQSDLNPQAHFSTSSLEDGHQIQEFVRSTIPLSNSIHAPPQGSQCEEKEELTSYSHQASNEKHTHLDPQRGDNPSYFPHATRRASNSSVGTIKSFNGLTPQPLLPPHIRLTPSPSAFMLTPDIHPTRFGSPTPSRLSVSSKSVSMDMDGWWSSAD